MQVTKLAKHKKMRINIMYFDRIMYLCDIKKQIKNSFRKKEYFLKLTYWTLYILKIIRLGNRLFQSQTNKKVYQQKYNVSGD